MGRRKKKPMGDPVDGILLLDKHPGVTSNQALQLVRRLLNAQKAGHTGSLDPIATGLLPICLGSSTKWSGYFLGAKKRYETTVRLGETTETGDSEGAVVRSSTERVSQQDIEHALDRFRGSFLQTPPMYSAIKLNGQPLYKLAREGIEVERESREGEVTDLRLIGFDGRDIVLALECSSGFYVRSLASDLGDALGVGGHVIGLRRLGVADLSIDDAVTVSELEDLDSPAERRRFVGDVGQALMHLPKVDLSVDAAFYVCRGQAVKSANLPESGKVRLYSAAAGFLGVGTVKEANLVVPERLMSA